MSKRSQRSSDNLDSIKTSTKVSFLSASHHLSRIRTLADHLLPNGNTVVTFFKQNVGKFNFIYYIYGF